jgi:hypothetical protein
MKNQIESAAKLGFALGMGLLDEMSKDDAS